MAIIENATWAASAGRIMRAELSKMKELEIVENDVTIKSSIKENDFDKIELLIEGLLK